MDHGITYIFINFQQNRISRSIKTVHTSLFTKKCNLYKFATTDINSGKINYFRNASIIKHTCMSICSKMGLVDQSKPRSYKFSCKKS